VKPSLEQFTARTESVRGKVDVFGVTLALVAITAERRADERSDVRKALDVFGYLATHVARIAALSASARQKRD